MRRHCLRVASLAGAAALFMASAPRMSAEVVLPIRIHAWMVNMSNNLTGANAMLEITVDRWSTAEERTKLLETVPKGQDDLLRALGRLPAKGRIRIPGWMGPDPQNYRLGWDLRYAWNETADGGERVVLATDRQMSFQEVRNQPRTVDYPFLIMQMHLDKEGRKGEGKMATFTQIRFDKKKNVMEMETYGTEPQRLNNITVEKK
jgi:hypothetical protein